MPGAAFSTIKMGINPLLNVVDLVIDPTAFGRGRIAIDRTPVTSLLIAMGSDRRADPDDVVPSMLTAPAGTVESIFARRGWVGDPLLPDDQRLGSKVWLRVRGKVDNATRISVAGDVAQAVAPIADYHGIDIDTDAAWLDRGRGILLVTASTLGVTVNAPLAVSQL